MRKIGLMSPNKRDMNLIYSFLSSSSFFLLLFGKINVEKFSLWNQSFEANDSTSIANINSKEKV